MSEYFPACAYAEMPPANRIKEPAIDFSDDKVSLYKEIRDSSFSEVNFYNHES